MVLEKYQYYDQVEFDQLIYGSSFNEQDFCCLLKGLMLQMLCILCQWIDVYQDYEFLIDELVNEVNILCVFCCKYFIWLVNCYILFISIYYGVMGCLVYCYCIQVEYYLLLK